MQTYQIDKQAVRNEKYFIYKSKKYPVDFDLLKKNSYYFYQNRKQFKNIDLINIADENQIDLPEEAILAFISSCQNESFQISPSFAIPLQYLSYKYNFPDLTRITDQYIKEHQNELLFDSLFFKTSQTGEKLRETAFYDTKNEENLIAVNLQEYIKDERMMLLSLPVLERIFYHYFKSSQKVHMLIDEISDFLSF